MTESPFQRVCRHLAGVWRQRRDLLLHALGRAPDSVSAGRWRIRVRILNYLLARYGDVPELPVPSERTHRRMICDPSPRRGYGTPPRSGDEIRAVLEDIAGCNERSRGKVEVLEGHVFRLDLSRLIDIADSLDPSTPQDSWN